MAMENKLFYIMFSCLFSLISFLSTGATISNGINASEKTIFGKITDAATGEILIGATVYYADGGNITVTNNFGFYSIRKAGQKGSLLSYSYIGYQAIIVDVDTCSVNEVNIALHPVSVTLEETTVIHNRSLKNLTESFILSPTQVKQIPSIGGEMDLVKVIQMMPGIQEGREGSNGLNVRGGSSDENLIMVDDVPLYYFNHLGGFVSVFNPDIVQNISMNKGSFPARYGGRLSSVLDIRLKDGDIESLEGDATLGIVSSRVSINGPIIKNRSSFVISARRFMYDMLMKPVTKYLYGTESGYTFYDLNLKANYSFNSRNKIYLSAYLGNDVLSTENKEETTDTYSKEETKEVTSYKNNWGSSYASLRLNHVFNHSLFSNLTFIFSNYHYRDNTTFNQNIHYLKDDASSLAGNQQYADSAVTISSGYNSTINDLGLKWDFEHSLFNGHSLYYGIGSTLHSFKPGLIQYTNSKISIDTSYNNTEVNTFENYIYLEDAFSLGNKFHVSLGGRVNFFFHNDEYFIEPEPRVSFVWNPSKSLALNIAHSSMSQYLHLLNYSGSGIPADLWLPATGDVLPEYARHISVGVTKSFKGGIQFSLTAYYKSLTNLINLKEGVSFYSIDNDWVQKIETGGSGSSKGIEMLFKKSEGSTTGWISYTLSKSDRQFPNINNGEKFPFKYDRTHDLKIVVVQKVSKKVELSAVWMFGTGYPITLPAETYQYNYTNYRIYNSINNYRMEDFHRLDISLALHRTKNGKERKWVFALFNLYNRKNPYYYSIRAVSNNDGTIKQQLIKHSLFPIMPSVSYSFKF